MWDTLRSFNIIHSSNSWFNDPKTLFSQEPIYNQLCFWWYYIQIWSLYEEQSGYNISNWNHKNRMASNYRWIIGWRRYILLRWFWYLATVVVLILWWIDNRSSYWKFLPHVEFRTTQTDTQIWYSVFIGAPCKTL